MQTWALVLGIIGTVAGLTAGGAAIYSLVIANKALGFEKDKWDESKKLALRVELRHDIEFAAPDEGKEGVRLVSVIGMYAYNEGSVPVRLTQGWLELGPTRSPFPIMSEYIAPCMSITVEPFDAKRITYNCGTLAKMAAEKNGLTGEIEINGFFYDSFRREYRNVEPLRFSIDMFYRDGVVIEDPLTDAKLMTCPEDGRQCISIPHTDGLIMKRRDEAKGTPQ